MEEQEKGGAVNSWFSASRLKAGGSGVRIPQLPLLKPSFRRWLLVYIGFPESVYNPIVKTNPTNCVWLA